VSSSGPTRDAPLARARVDHRCPRPAHRGETLPPFPAGGHVITNLDDLGTAASYDLAMDHPDFFLAAATVIPLLFIATTLQSDRLSNAAFRVVSEIHRARLSEDRLVRRSAVWAAAVIRNGIGLVFVAGFAGEALALLALMTPVFSNAAVMWIVFALTVILATVVAALSFSKFREEVKSALDEKGLDLP
jgi:hypothetical protein